VNKSRPGFADYFYYSNGMARPLKDPKLRMSIDLRIPVTAGQKQVLQQAGADYPPGLAAWARQVLLQPAQKRLRPRGQKGVRSMARVA